jgi:hypothetical protein
MNSYPSTDEEREACSNFIATVLNVSITTLKKLFVDAPLRLNLLVEFAIRHDFDEMLASEALRCLARDRASCPMRRPRRDSESGSDACVGQ